MTACNLTPLCYGFLLVPDFTFIGFASAIEPLRMANKVSAKTLYHSITITLDGHSVTASNGVQIVPEYSLETIPHLDALFLCGANPIHQKLDRTLSQRLRQLAYQGVALGGICTGSYYLAGAGLLDGYRCTIHWEDRYNLVRDFPDIIVSSNLFEVDRDRYTCSGGIAPIDMMLELLSQQPQGTEIATTVSELMVCERIRTAEECQRIPLRHQLGTGKPKLTEAVTLMEANIEEPISIDDLATYIQLSCRQLERLFHDNLHDTPTGYYMKVRLQKARHLLLNTDARIIDVALACGFVSVAHFTTRYGKHFGLSPTQQRYLK